MMKEQKNSGTLTQKQFGIVNPIIFGDYPLTVGSESWYPTPLFGSNFFELDEEGKMKIPQMLKDVVGFLYVKVGDKFEAIGTAFFVVEVESDIGFFYLVTCKHVIKESLEAGETIYARFNRADKLDVDYIPLPDSWIYHNDPAVDLAVLPWIPPKKGQYQTRWGALPTKDFILTDKILKTAKENLTEGNDVVFIGLFHQYTGTRRNFPVVRNGKIALVTDEPVLGEYGESDYLFIEAQAYPGNSGAPLFASIYWKGRETLFLAGIVSAYYPEQQRYFVAPNTIEVYTHFGISLAVPVEKLSDILYGDELMKRRKDRIGASQREKAPKRASITPSSESDEGVMTREDFLNILGKVAKPLPTQPDSETKEK
jgi:hypothetical protein